jgi:protein TonB
MRPDKSSLAAQRAAIVAGTRRMGPARPPWWERYGGLALTVAFHVAVIGALLQLAPVQQALLDAAPIMVKFITPPQLESPPPAPPPRPTPPVKPPPPAVEAPRIAHAAPPLIASHAAPVDAPAMVQAPAPKPVELPPMEAPPPPPRAAPAPVTPPVFAAAYLHNPAPAYPAAARRRQEEGKVMLRVYVSAAGGAEKVELQQSSGFPHLDQAAMDAVRGWRFVPARQGDTSVAAWVIVPINFILEG